MIDQKYYFKAPYVFIPVPKVATTTMEDILGNWLGWAATADHADYLKATPQDQVKYFGLVREPVERWASGMAQHFVGTISKETGKPKYGEADLPNIKDDAKLNGFLKVHDVHTLPQVEFFKETPNPTLFKLENMAAMWTWLGVTVPEGADQKLHVSDELGAQGDLVTHLKAALGRHPAYKAKLETLYAEDTSLYQSAMVMTDA